jgi:hypothetical protein
VLQKFRFLVEFSRPIEPNDLSQAGSNIQAGPVALQVEAAPVSPQADDKDLEKSSTSTYPQTALAMITDVPETPHWSRASYLLPHSYSWRQVGMEWWGGEGLREHLRSYGYSFTCNDRSMIPPTHASGRQKCTSTSASYMPCTSVSDSKARLSSTQATYAKI